MEQTEEELLEYAKKHYPIGTHYIPAHVDKGVNEVTDAYYDYTKHKNEYIHVGSKYIDLDYNNCIYADGKWATIVEPNYKALQNKAWEVFKDVKKGDRYISTRGSELVATKNAFKTTGSKEESCYIECGPGFLWEIKNGKELYGTLLPKEEEKWIPKVGDWVVSLEDMIFNRSKGDVFQVLEVYNNSIYYKKGVNGATSTFRPAELHEIPIPLTSKIVPYTNTNVDLSIPKHLLEYKNTSVKPKFNSEEIKIQVKKSKTIKI